MKDEAISTGVKKMLGLLDSFEAKEQAKENVKNPSLDSDGQFFLPFPFSPLFTKDERTTLILVAHVTRR